MADTLKIIGTIRKQKYSVCISIKEIQKEAVQYIDVRRFDEGKSKGKPIIGFGRKGLHSLDAFISLLQQAKSELTGEEPF